MRIPSTEFGVLLLVGCAGWYGFTHYETEIKQRLGLAPVPTVRVLGEQFRCDHRIYCSQMKSCAEARYFLRYCPNTKLDRADNGGIDCEKQWCDGEGGRLIDLFTK
ncbi:MAG: DNA-binding protein [Casimicrobiaceae bacterium]